MLLDIQGLGVEGGTASLPDPKWGSASEPDRTLWVIILALEVLWLFPILPTLPLPPSPPSIISHILEQRNMAVNVLT